MATEEQRTSGDQAADDSLTIGGITGCARCGGNHPGPLEARKLARAFAPPEAGGITWSHWLSCPANGEPILISTTPGRRVFGEPGETAAAVLARSNGDER